MGEKKSKKLIRKVTKQILRESGKKLLIIISIPIIVLTTVALLYYATTVKVQEKVSELFSDVTNKVEISENGTSYKINEDYLNNAKRKLKSMGVNSNTLGLDGYEDYLSKFLEAEITTNFPHIGDDGLQGAVYFERAGYDGITTELKYMKYDDFYKKDQKEDLRNYFTIDPKDWTVHVQTLTGDNEKSIEKIDYKSMVSRFAMPFEFPIALAQVTQNPPFCLAVVNLVKNSRIVITIAETKTTTKTEIVESHDRTTESFNSAGVKVASSSERVTTNVKSSTDVSFSSTTYLSYAHVWIADYGESPKYKDHTDVSKTTKKLPDTSSRSASDTFSTYTSTSNGVETTTITTRTQEWIKGGTDISPKIDRFTRLILRDEEASEFSGEGLVAIAKTCHDYLAKNNYWYPTRNNLATGGAANENSGTPRIHKFPEEGEPSSKRYVDCSAYVSWVLQKAGYKAGLLRAADIGIWGKSQGWEVIKGTANLQAGDICIWHGGNHVNICVGKDSKGRNIFYDCGCTNRIRTVEPILYNGTPDYSVRPNDAIAKSLGAAKTSEDLKDQIEKYIKDNVKDGKYSVSYVDVDDSYETSESIKNSRVSTNGWIKLYIMAAAYNEVANGKVKLEEVDGNIGHMIDSDGGAGTSAANSILKSIGKNNDENKGIEIVNQYIYNGGYSDTNIGKKLVYNKEVDENYTSVEDVTTLLKKIKEGSCVSKEYSAKMEDLLKRTQAGDKDMIPTIVDANEGIVGHKKSEIVADNGKNNVQDAAIVSIKKANYVVAISAENVSSKSEAKKQITEIAKLINNYFVEHGKLKNNKDADIDKEIRTKMNGRRVCYRQRDGRWICPLSNLIEGRDILFDLLARREKTQSYERLMRYILYKLTGHDYGVTEFDFNELFGDNEFTDASGGIIGNTTKEKVFWTLYNFLRNNGISDAQARISAAGAMGNIEGESSFRPDAIEYPSQEGHGLCQWSFDRKTRLFGYAKAKGVSWKDENMQLEYLLGELTPGGGCQRLCSL